MCYIIHVIMPIVKLYILAITLAYTAAMSGIGWKDRQWPTAGHATWCYTSYFGEGTNVASAHDVVFRGGEVYISCRPGYRFPQGLGFEDGTKVTVTCLFDHPNSWVFYWNPPLKCIDVDECEADACGLLDCTNTPGNYFCHCPVGFLPTTDGLACVDYDECKINNGHCSQKCINEAGSFHCDCNVGYILKNGTEAYGIDDIKNENDEAYNSYDLQTETNGFHEFKDTTDENFDVTTNILDTTQANDATFDTYDGKDCKDIDECSTNNGGCAHNCTNTPGSYVCSCVGSYVLAVNQHSCELK